MNNLCKICGSPDIVIFAHTATCMSCGVLLAYPYPESDQSLFLAGKNRDNIQDSDQIREEKLQWHISSGHLNHNNFTAMANFALDKYDRNKEIKVLDYGGGGGQFSLVLKSLYPLADSYLVDIEDNKLLHQYRTINKQIKYRDFEKNQQKFDVVFMNDVFEHVSDPLSVLQILSDKLTNNGKIFIDTPCQFWIYPVTKILNKNIYKKVLDGTVDYDHQQIWNKKSFEYIVDKAGFCISKYVETSEFTQPAKYYLDGMRINNPILRMVGTVFYKLAPWIAKNKIMAVIRCK